MCKTVLCFSMMLAVLALSPVCRAGTPDVLYNFCTQTNCTDGANPMADLVQDPAGNLWGTTKNGGANQFGVVFELTQPDYKNQGQVYSFQGGANDGAYPVAGLVYDPTTGIFFGTTSAGGTGNCPGGCGVIFALQPGSQFDKPLYFFLGGSDGATPTAELLEDSSGILYGTTSAGGTTNCRGGCGTVFSLNPTTGIYNQLYAFTGRADGANPAAALVFDSNGNLWGTAENGGAKGVGTVFELLAPGYTQLGYVHSFRGAPGGANPAAALTFDAQAGGALGTLYGTTSAGGTGACTGGCGTAFELVLSGLVFKSFYNFTGAGAGKSGAAPIARLALETKDPVHLGHLYGTASVGGSTAGNCGAAGCGTAFEICPPTRAPCTTPKKEYTLLQFDFTDGANPAAGLLLDIPLPLEDLGFPGPLTGGRGQCGANCVGTAQSGGSNGGGTVIGIKP